MIKDKSVEVCSKSKAREFLCDIPWACISVVSESGDWPVISDKNRVDLLQLDFHDRSNMHYVNHPLLGSTYFSKDQARQVLEFVDKNWDNIDCLMVHCEAGVSRSAAIAAAIELIKFGRGADNHYFNESTHYVPNTYVYRMMLETWQEIAGGEVQNEDLTKEAKEEILDEPWDPRS